MKQTRNTRIPYLFFLVFCVWHVGCDSADTKQGGPADPTTQTVSENLTEVVASVEELKFCVSEGVGVETLRSTFDRMVTVLDVLPNSIEASGLPSAEQAKLTTAVERIRTACQASELTTESAYAGLCKDVAVPLKVLVKHSDP